MPPSVGQLRAGRAIVELMLNRSPFERGLRAAQARMRAFGANVQAIGAQLAKVAALAAAPLAASTVVFASFEQRMARVKALTNATGKDFEALSNKAKQLGETTVFTAGQAAEAMSFFALAGFKVHEILDAIGPTLNLAATGQIEIAQAADIAAKTMKSMEISASELTHVVDVMAKAMTTANTDLQQIGDAMKFVGPIANTAGQSIEGVVAAIQILSDAGIQGEMAGTTLRTGILSLTAPSEIAKKKLQELNVEIGDAEGNVRPLVEIIGQLERALKDFGSEERLEALGTIFTARSAAGFAALVNKGADLLEDRMKALQSAGGTAARISKTQLDTLKGRVTILTSALEGLGIAIAEGLSGPLGKLVEHITSVIGGITTWVKANKDAILSLALIISSVAAFGFGLIALGLTIKLTAFLIGSITLALGALKIAVAAAVFAFNAFTGLAFLLNPIVAGIGLITIGILGMTGQFDKAVAGIRSGAESIAGSFSRLKDRVLQSWGGILDAVKAGDLELAFKIVTAQIEAEWARLLRRLGMLWDRFVTLRGAGLEEDVARELGFKSRTELERDQRFQPMAEEIGRLERARLSMVAFAGLKRQFRDLNNTLSETAKKFGDVADEAKDLFDFWFNKKITERLADQARALRKFGQFGPEDFPAAGPFGAPLPKNLIRELQNAGPRFPGEDLLPAGPFGAMLPGKLVRRLQNMELPDNLVRSRGAFNPFAAVGQGIAGVRTIERNIDNLAKDAREIKDNVKQMNRFAGGLHLQGFGPNFGGGGWFQ